jgi:parallel beta-helix repeat protein
MNLSGIRFCALAASFVVALAAFPATAQGVAADIVISRDTVITGDFIVASNRICMIKPGITIKFAGYGRMGVYGVLVASGTADSEIVITAEGRPEGSTAAPDWKGIEIVGSAAAAQVRHCRFEGAFRNLVWEASPVFDSCTFAGNHYALYCAKQAKPHVRSCSFFRNKYGITVDLAAPLLLDNTITENSIGLYLLLCSESLVGRNIIKSNGTNIKIEESLGGHKGSMSLHYLWNVMNQLY